MRLGLTVRKLVVLGNNLNCQICFAGEAVSMEGKVKYEDMVQLLSCMNCGEMCVPPISQCRKGHLYCITCKATNRTCKVCKQTMVDSPNIALDRLLSFIALPCKFG